ncbi:unnamed protein product [Rotaria sp. Silwood1]|nr:unnamed protein product [Rotaria sp. Silwood1]
MRNGMIIGALLNSGVWIRLFALISPNRGYAALVIGQIFPSMAGPFFLNLTAEFAARWFPPKQRDVATALCSMANPLGGAVGSLLPSLVVIDGSSSHQFFLLLLIEAAFTTLAAFLVIVVIRSEPPSPPSPSEEHHQSIDIREDLKRLLTNRHYLILLFGFALGFDQHQLGKSSNLSNAKHPKYGLDRSTNLRLDRDDDDADRDGYDDDWD